MIADADTLEQMIPWAVGALFAALLLLERFFPLRRSTRRFPRRAALNLIAAAAAFGVAACTVAPVSASALSWVARNEFGLLHWAGLTGWSALIPGMLLLDLSFYYWHRLNHRLSWLWRFHNVHHIDPDLDSTTSFRFHFGEIAYSSIFRAGQIAIIGPGALVFVVYELLFLAGTVFHHSNVRLPYRFERALNYVIVTPRMHGIHHSIIRNETNSNYSVVFRWWDPLHRTLRLNVPQAEIRIGVAAYTREEDHALNDLFILPFRRQRAYWRRPDGAPSHEREGRAAAAKEHMRP